MDAKTLEALKASIDKWEKNVSLGLDGAKIHSSSCPLCTLFLGGKTICDGCPVAIKAQSIGCVNTPWGAASTAYLKNSDKAFRNAAREEVAFLKSLLTEESA